jgi:hypothetical protein
MEKTMLFSILLACTSTEKTDSGTLIVDQAPIDWMRGNPKLTESDTSIRAIVHLHSHHSHDACDGDPQPDGIPDEACLGDLREALCTNLIDAAFLSDHPTHSTEAEEFEELFLMREGDQPVYEGELLIANQMTCESGHQVLIFPGVESSSMMPLALTNHIEGSYDGSANSVDQVREQSAVLWIAHTEEREIETLLELELDGLEIYQLHANLDPGIRSEYLGLDAFGYIQEIQPFFFPLEEETNSPHPDLSVLGFLLPNEPSIEKMEQVGMVQPIGVSGGTDAHQNVFSNDAPDGERIDSYRRMTRWFNTRIDVKQGSSALEIKEALRNRKTWITFEVLGTVDGFDAVVVGNGTELPIGSEFTIESGQELQVTLPILSSSSPQDPYHPPMIEGRVFHFDGQNREQVHTWTSGTAILPITETGVYRVEVWIQPLHLKPYLGDRPEYAEKWMPWIYSGGFFAR